MQNKTRQLLIHVLGSIAFLLLPVLFSPDLISTIGFYNIPAFQEDFISYVFLLLFFYLNYLVLLPYLCLKKKYLLFFSCVIACYILIEWIPGYWVNGENVSEAFKGHPYLNNSGNHPPYPNYFILHHFSDHFFQFLIVFLFSLLQKISIRLKQTEQEKLNFELSYLKAQINPHFLFNTLNSIYSLAISKSDETPAAIVKLSGMMRFVLSEANQNFVSLEKEINYISNYIELQRLRLEDTVTVVYNMNGTTAGKQIAPLILIPFVENAFKHGVNPEEDSHIEINISINDTGVKLKVNNNKVNNVEASDQRNGLGIENAKARLQLVYPAKHYLVIENAKKKFSVELTIDLT